MNTFFHSESKMNGYPCVYAFLNGCTDFGTQIAVCLTGSRDDLDSQLDQVDPTRGGDQTEILRFTMDIFVYKWFLLVIGEIISIN